MTTEIRKGSGSHTQSSGDRALSSPVASPGDLVVGFRHLSTCSRALQYALEEVESGRFRKLVVVHASSFPVAVHNGPTSEVAAQLGNPDWAVVHPTVAEAVAASGADPETTQTVVEPGDPIVVIARHAMDAALVVLGSHRRRRRRHRGRLRTIESELARLIDVPIVRVSPTGSVRPADSGRVVRPMSTLGAGGAATQGLAH